MHTPLLSTFLSAEDNAASAGFLSNGHIIHNAEAPENLARIRDLAVQSAAEYLAVTQPEDRQDFLNYIHRHITGEKLNGLRLHVIQRMNQTEWLRPAYFSLARKLIETIVGNELAMQLRLNLSIQMPDDAGSLLPIHADVWSGDSPFEVVLWVPLVDCFATKAMFLLPPAKSGQLESAFSANTTVSSEALFERVATDLTWINIKYGEVLLFNQNLPHGNRVNIESETRWSMNCRFKAVFTPYADKRLGEFFEPITLRAASRLGLDYQLPAVAVPGALQT